MKVIALSSLCALSLAVPANSQGDAGPPASFRSGELYYSSNVLFGTSSNSTGILRIDPITGQADAILGPVAAGSSSSPNFAYDPYRDRLITSLALDLVNKDVYFVDAAGGTQSAGIPGQTVTNFAPVGDGRIYMTIEGGLSADIHYIDAAGTLLQLMDATGSAPFQLDPTVGSGVGFSGMIFEPGTNALFVATQSAAFVCGAADTVNVHRIPLSADGSRLSGPVQCAEFDVDPIDSFETPEGWSRGPFGDLFLVVDTNSNAQQPRMLRVDPVSLAVTAFASNGSYLGAAATNSGCYSHVRGQGGIVDSFAGTIRFYDEGEAGGGTSLTIVGAPGTFLYGNGQQATLTEIGPIGPHDGLIGGPLTMSVAAGGTQSWTLAMGAPLAGNLYIVLGSLSGWNPSTPLIGVPMPIVLDSYTLFTGNHANSALLPGSLGTLGPQGDTTAAFVLPGGVLGPSAVGTVAHHAALIVDGALAGLQATNALPLELVP